MAIALVTGQHADANFGSAATSIAVSFPVGTTAGNLITEVSLCNSAQSPTTPTDDKSNTYAVGAPQTIETTGTQVVTGYYAKNCIGAAVTVTAHFSASTGFQGIEIQEWSGADTTAPLDQTDGKFVATSTDALGNAKTPGQNNELILSHSVNDGGASNVTGTSFALLDANAASGLASAYFVQGTAAAVQSEYKISPAADFAVLLATFKVAAAAAAASGAGYYVRKKHWSAVT